MRTRRPRNCSYVVAVDLAASDEELQALAAYLSGLGSAGCDVLVIDPAPAERLESRARILRWVGRHVPTTGQHRLPDGDFDLIQTAVDLALTDKIIIAAAESRYTNEEVTSICNLLDRAEAIEPEEFIAPLPWWGGLEAGRMLLYRGLEHPHREGKTFAFRRSAWRPLRVLEERAGESHLRRLLLRGADIQTARDVFVRREPAPLQAWLRTQLRETSAEMAAPFQTAIFAGVLPLLAVLVLVGGLGLAASYTGLVGLASVVLAVRGRAGVARFFPLRACLFAPLWLLQRSIGVYWAIGARLRRPKDAGRPASDSPAGASEAVQR